MPEGHSFLSAVVTELSQRKVLRTVGGYAVAVFVILQLMDAAVEPLRLPDWLPTLVVIAVILGFPLVFLLAWQFDITSGGVKRAAPGGLLSRTQNFFMFSMMLLTTAGLGYGFFQYYAGVFEGDQRAVPQGLVDTRTFVAPENSIAVLPFTDLSEEKNQAHFSDGIAEEILNMLAQVDSLHVAARTSSFAFRDPQTSIREIGRLLNVSTVLEGSVRTAGNRIRMTAQLINVADGYHIWSQTFDREMDDVFAIQDEVASAIATALVDSFAGLNSKPTSRTRNIAAFEAFRTGRLHWWRRSPQEIQKAIELFAKALEHDPQFAPAYAAIADSLLLLSSYGNISQMQAIERAQPMIEKALAIDPESAEGFAALGLARWQIGQTDAAESALRQAVSLNADYIPARLWLGGLLGDLGRVPEQGQVLQEAMALDPLNELLAINYAGNLFVRGHYQEAKELLAGLIQLKPDSPTLLHTMSNYAVGNGDLVEAWDYAQRSFDLEPESPKVISALAQAWMQLGEYDRAQDVLQGGLDLAADNTDLKVQFYFLMLVTGRTEEAERIVREQYTGEVEELPEKFQRFYHFQTGLLRLVKGDLPAARDELELSIDSDESGVFDGNKVFAIGMVAWLDERLGDSSEAEVRLMEAERALRRARINGMDHADIYYTEAGLYSMRGNTQKAVEALQQAYDRGWRQGWLLELDARLEGLKDNPGFLEIKRQIEEDIARARLEVLELNVVML